MSSLPNLSSSASSKSGASIGGGGIKRRVRADSDQEMLRELVKVLCECLYRSRTKTASNSQLSQGAERVKKTKWFGIVSDRVADVERLMADWNPHLTTIVSIMSDSVLTECWSIRYTLNVTELRGRVYSKLMVLVRSLITTAQVLPCSRNRSRNEIQVRFCETDGEPFDVVPPLSEQFVFPSVDMSFGKVDLQVRYRNDIALLEPSSGMGNSLASVHRRNSGQNILGPSIVEDYIGGGRSPVDNDATEEEEADNRRWRRWASESFDERERELAQASPENDPRRGSVADEDDDEPDISAPPSNARATSNPMAIPKSNVDNGAGNLKRAFETTGSPPSHLVSYRGSRVGTASPDDIHFASSAPANISGSRISRKLSGMSDLRRDSFRGLVQAGSEEGPAKPIRQSNSFGYSVADLVAYSSTGTPILTSLPFAVGSLASSSASVQDSSKMQPDAASLRTRFLAGNDFSSSSPPFPVVLMSAGSLMVSRHSSALALLDNQLHSPSPQLPGAVTPPPAQTRASTSMYEAALPWVLTPAEMERPFSSMGASVTLGANLDETASAPRDPSVKRKSKQRSQDEDIDDNEHTLPFVADEDLEMTMEENAELGSFVRRCRESKPIFVGQEKVNIDEVKKQLDMLYVQTGIGRNIPQNQEVVTVYEERPL